MNSKAQLIFQKGIQQILEDAQVPAKHHLKVIQLLHQKIKEHKQDTDLWHKVLGEHVKQIKQHEVHEQKHSEQIDAYQKELERSRTIAKGEVGEKGERGEIGIGIAGKDGHDGKDGKDGLDGRDGKDAIFDEDAFTKSFLDKVRKGQLLDLSHIKGAQGFIKDGVKYRFEELMHGAGKGGGSSPTALTGIINGSNLNFTTATPATIVFTEGGTFTNGFGVTITGLAVVFAAGLAPQQWAYYL